MYLTKKHLSRRTVLKGAGVTLALPLLDAMIPAATALAQTAAVPKMRMGFFYIPHGAIMGNTSLGPDMDRWTPSGSGADFKLSSILASLESHKTLRDVVRQPSEQRDGGRRAQPRTGDVVERDEAGQSVGRRKHVDHARSGGGAAYRSEHDAAVARSRVGNHAAGRGVQRVGVLLQHDARVSRRAFTAADGVQPA